MTELRQKEPRRHDSGYLAALRKMPCCCGCGRPAPSDAAHIRAASLAYGKRSVGFGEKPHDRWALPLNRLCHQAQHAYGSELLWWRDKGIEPFKLAARLYSQYGSAQEATRKRRTIRPRKPRGQRKAIQQPRKATQWPSRKIASRRKGK